MIIKISNTPTQVELVKGHCYIYILGGWYVKTNENFKIEIINIQTKEAVVLIPKLLRVNSWLRGKRAVRYYDIVVKDTGMHEISFHNFEDLIVKNNYPLIEMFNWLNLFKKSDQITEYEIAIERH